MGGIGVVADAVFAVRAEELQNARNTHGPRLLAPFLWATPDDLDARRLVLGGCSFFSNEKGGRMNSAKNQYMIELLKDAEIDVLESRVALRQLNISIDRLQSANDKIAHAIRELQVMAVTNEVAAQIGGKN